MTTQSLTVRHIVGPTILLYGGTYFDFLNPSGSEFTIYDIAHALSQICRFGGQCKRFYSVAEHCVHVSNIVSPQFAYVGLMHDAPEAFVGDVCRPLKDLLPEYRTIERAVERAVFDRFNVPPIPPEVKEADIVMLSTEQRQMMLNRDDWDYTRGRACADLTLHGWEPVRAKAEFMERFTSLSGEAEKEK